MRGRSNLSCAQPLTVAETVSTLVFGPSLSQERFQQSEMM